jgi:hypothetical protein
MFEPLLSRLSDEFHLIAPDYPGFGHSDWPSPLKFDYTFDRMAAVMDHFLQSLRLHPYTLYMQDYGGPVGFRLALADSRAGRPECRRSRQGLGRKLENTAQILDGSSRKRVRFARQSAVVDDHSRAARWK